MIEISHQNARRMIQESLDRPLPEAQWTVLQTHLETCVSCRAHRLQLLGLERELRRDLKARWAGMPDPQAVYAGRLKVLRSKKRKARLRVLASTLAVLVLLLFWVSGGFGWLAANLTALGKRSFPSAASRNVPPAGGSGQAGENAPGFTSQVLFSASLENHGDLYLINPDGAIENLTGVPGRPAADHIDPAWSPDGAWIAYLSDQSGKSEVYVTGLDQRDPVQLTQAPGIEWAGPLSWSPDGQWIALTGIRSDQGNQSWIYLVSLDGGDGPSALAGTRGGWAPEFSPAGTQLAFLTGQGEMGGVAVYTFSPGAGFSTVEDDIHWVGPSAYQGTRVVPGMITFTNARVENFGMPESDLETRQVALPGQGLDWSPDGQGLVYIGEGARGKGARITIQRLMDYSISLYDDYQVTSVVAESSRPTGFSAVSWLTGGAVAYLQDNLAARPGPDPQAAHACWSLETRRVSEQSLQLSQVTLGGLCVESGLDRSSWSADRRWLVLVGRNAGESRRFLYAVRMPGTYAQRGPVPGTLVRISTAAELFDSGAQPLVRPSGPALGIDPRPVRTERAEIPPSDIHSAPGEIVFSLRNNSVTVIVSASPDGTRGRVLTTSNGNNRCPRYSPDGSLLAFVSDGPSGLNTGAGDRLGVGGGAAAPTLVQEVYLMPAQGGPPAPVSNHRRLPGSGSPAQSEQAPVYGCPVWSPDGKYVAAPLFSTAGVFLSILPLPEQRSAGAREQFIRLDDSLRGFSWTADSRHLVLIQGDNNWLLPEVLVASLPSLAGGALGIETHRLPGVLGSITGLAVDPSGEQVYLFDTQNTGSTTALAFLRQFSLEGWVERNSLALGQNSRMRIANEDALAVLGENGLGFILHGRSEGQYKSQLMRFNVKRGRLETLAEFEDVITSAAWTRDGSWVIFSAESGLWALDADLARRGQAAPVWISPQPVEDLDWR